MRDLRRFLHAVHTAAAVTVAGQRVFDFSGRCRAIDDGDVAAIRHRAGGIRLFPAGDSSQIDALGCPVSADAGPVRVLSGQ